MIDQNLSTFLRTVLKILNAILRDQKMIMNSIMFQMRTFTNKDGMNTRKIRILRILEIFFSGLKSRLLITIGRNIDDH